MTLKELRASAARGMTEDAPREHAAARERLLQHYREASELGIDEVEWLAQLAHAGHVPAGQLLERVLNPTRIEQLLADAFPRVLALVPTAPRLARYLAWCELQRPAPAVPRLCEWLEAGGFSSRDMAQALRELVAIAGAPSEKDIGILRSALGGYSPGEFPLVGFSVHEFLLAFAEQRSGAAGRALLERAAATGSRSANEVLFAEGFNTASDKVAFVQAWFAVPRPLVPGIAVRPCLQLGAGLERAGRFADAIAWYERGIGRKAYDLPDALDMNFCFMLARAFDKRTSAVLVDDAQLAMRWHARAADAGDERSLDYWLLACVRGEMGVASDPAAALERVRRFRASGIDMKSRRWRLESSLKALRAANWHEVLALLEKD